MLTSSFLAITAQCVAQTLLRDYYVCSFGFMPSCKRDLCVPRSLVYV